MEGWMWDHYNISVPMSTYLVAFVVSDFQSRTADPSLSKPEFRVWARKDAIDQAEYARDIGPKILTYYEKYFDIEFPLPKQDMIALPDFGMHLILFYFGILIILWFYFNSIGDRGRSNGELVSNSLCLMSFWLFK